MIPAEPPEPQVKPWLAEARKVKAVREAAKAERKARGPRPRPTLVLVCQFCGQTFKATRPDAKYCPKPAACRSNAAYRRKREELPVLKRRALRLTPRR